MTWSRGASALGVLRAHLALRAAGAEVGALPRLRGTLRLSVEGRLVIGDRLLLDSGTYPTQIHVGPNGVLEFGDDVFINQGADISATMSVSFGDRVLVGPHVTVVDDSAHDVAPEVPRRVAPVVVESDVWLGRRCMLMPGVTVGRFSVVGAGTVVTSDVPPCTVVVGVPARVVRTFEEPPAGFRR